MTQSWHVRTYRKGDEEGVLELMRIRGIERTNEEWLWEYERNPFGHLIGVSEYEGQIVGHMALVFTYLKVGDEVVKGSQAVDLEVHPKFRRQGMFLAIGMFLKEEARRQGIEILYGFPNEPARSGHLKYGWFDVCQVPLLMKPINMDKVAQAFIFRHKRISFLNRHKLSRNVVKAIFQISYAIVDFFFRISNWIEYKNPTKNLEIRTIESFDNRVDDLWKKASMGYTVVVARNKRYLNWRYFGKPNAPYKVLLAEKNGELLGYIVLLARKEDELRFGYIVDVFAPGYEKTVLQSLILQGIEYFRQENVDLILCLMMEKSRSGHVYYKTLRSNGFIPYFVQPTVPLIALVNSQRLSRGLFEDSRNWYVTMGDSDGI
jgi:GNAT superfamily N-acetyltransferase